MKYLLLLLSLNVFASGSVLSGGSYKHRTDWKTVWDEEGFSEKCDVVIKNTTKVDGVLDGKGRTYCWKGAGYPKKCHAPEELSESEPRMFEMRPGSTIKNMKVVCSLDGFLMNDNTTISNVTFMDAEEDAITTKGNGNVIKNNKFYLCQDKCIQMNQAKKVVIEGNHFKHSLRALSGSGSNYGGANGIVAKNNSGANVEIFIRAQSDHDITASGNVLNGGRDLFETVDKAVIYDCGGNAVEGGANYRSKKGSDNIKSCR